MKKYVLASFLCLFILATNAQEYKIAKSSGKLVMNLSSVQIEGYNGNELVFSSTKDLAEGDERAKGLRPINGSGFIDNTGLGINVTDKNGTIEVNQVSQKSITLKILVPKGFNISYSYNNVMNAGKASFKNIESEIEISVQHNKIELEKIMGPITVKSIYGEVNVIFGETIKGPISIASIYGHVDVALPVTTKANLKLNTNYGEILADPDFKIDIEKTGELVSYSNNVKGKLNGGGTDISLISNYGKVYLRKTK